MQSIIQFISGKWAVLCGYLIDARRLPTSAHSQLDVASPVAFNAGILSQDTCLDVESHTSTISASDLDHTPSMLLYTWSVHTAPSENRPPRLDDAIILILQVGGDIHTACATICGFTTGFTKDYVVAKAKIDTPFHHYSFSSSTPDPSCLCQDGFYTEEHIPRFARGVVPILVPTRLDSLPLVGTASNGGDLARLYSSATRPPFAVACLSASAHLPTIVRSSFIREIDVDLPDHHPTHFTRPLPSYVLHTRELQDEAATCPGPALEIPTVGVYGMMAIQISMSILTIAFRGVVDVTMMREKHRRYYGCDILVFFSSFFFLALTVFIFWCSNFYIIATSFSTHCECSTYSACH